MYSTVNKTPCLQERSIISRLAIPVILCTSLAVSFTPIDAFAQTKFEWPDSRVDVTQYHYLENCFAAAKRVSDSLYARNEVLVDTVTVVRGTGDKRLPEGVVDIAQRCTKKFTVDQVPITQTFLAQELYMIADRDADAAAVVQHRLSAIKATDSVERARVLDTVARTYLKAVPHRIAVAQPFVNQITELGAVVSFDRRMGIYWEMVKAANRVKDDALVKQYGTALVDVVRGMTEKERASPDAWVIPIAVRAVNKILYRAELMDSLRKSTEAFVALQQALFSKATGASDVDLPAGKPVPVLEGDFWFPESARNVQYPQSGKVTLVSFVRPRLVSNAQDLSQQTALRRVASRYPDVELILVTSTRGYFGPLEPPNAAKESALMDSLFRKFQAFPAVLTVTTGSFIALSDPDRRRIYQTDPNSENYPGTGGLEGRDKTGHTYLIDQDGKLVDMAGLSTENEESFTEMVEILLKRNKVAQH